MSDDGDDRERNRDLLLEKILVQAEATNEMPRQIPAIKETVDQHTVELRDIKGCLIVVEDIVREHSADLKER